MPVNWRADNRAADNSPAVAAAVADITLRLRLVRRIGFERRRLPRPHPYGSAQQTADRRPFQGFL
jgi:hypothetical protein